MTVALAETLERIAVITPGGAASVGKLDDGWFTAASVTADPSAHLTQIKREYPGADARTQGALLMNQYGYYVLAAPIAAYLTEQRVPNLSPENVGLRWVTYTWHEDGESGEAERLDVRFASGRFTALPGDPSAGGPNVNVVADANALRDHLRGQIEAHFAPLVAAVHAQTRLSRGALWRLVADDVALLFLTVGQQAGQAEQAQREGLAVIKAVGSPVNNPQTGYFTVTANGEAVPFRARGGCCRYYALPDGGKCSTCVLHSPTERDSILAAYLEHRTRS